MNKQIVVNDIRTQNMRNVISAIIAGKALSRTDIVRATGLSSATVSSIVSEFIGRGVICERKFPDTNVGRKPFVISAIPKSIHLGVADISSHRFSFSAYDFQLSEEFFIECAYRSELTFEENYRELLGLLKLELEQRGLMKTLSMVGFVTPGPYIEELDEVKCKRMDEFEGVKLRSIAAEYFPCRTYYEEDVKLAALANLTQNARDIDRSFCYIYIWEGMGGAFVDHGEVLHGANMAAFNIGQMLLTDGRKAEDAVCQASLFRAVADAAGREPADNAELEALATSEQAAAAVDDLIDIVAISILNVCWLFDPEAVVVESCYNFLGNRFLNAIKKKLSAYLYEQQIERMDVRLSAHNVNMARIGCGYLLQNHWYSNL